MSFGIKPSPVGGWQITFGEQSMIFKVQDPIEATCQAVNWTCQKTGDIPANLIKTIRDDNFRKAVVQRWVSLIKAGEAQTAAIAKTQSEQGVPSVPDLQLTREEVTKQFQERLQLLGMQLKDMELRKSAIYGNRWDPREQMNQRNLEQDSMGLMKEADLLSVGLTSISLMKSDYELWMHAGYAPLVAKWNANRDEACRAFISCLRWGTQKR